MGEKSPGQALYEKARSNLPVSTIWSDWDQLSGYKQIKWEQQSSCQLAADLESAQAEIAALREQNEKLGDMCGRHALSACDFAAQVIALRADNERLVRSNGELRSFLNEVIDAGSGEHPYWALAAQAHADFGGDDENDLMIDHLAARAREALAKADLPQREGKSAWRLAKDRLEENIENLIERSKP